MREKVRNSLILVLIMIMSYDTYTIMIMKTKRRIKINLSDTINDYNNNDTYDDNCIK